MKNLKYGEISYLRRKNEGNYEHTEISVSAVVEENDPAAVLNHLRDIVYSALYPSSVSPISKGSVVTPEPVAAAEPVVAEEPAKTPAKAKAKKAAAAPKETETPAVAEEKAEEPKAPRVVKKAAIYDRQNDLHKKLVGEILDLEYPTWRKDTAKAKAASAALEGKDFLDTEGLILPSFKAEFKKLMA